MWVTGLLIDDYVAREQHAELGLGVGARRAARLAGGFLVELSVLRCLGEDDLAAGGEAVELADGDDVLDLGDEVVLGQVEQVDRGLAGVERRRRSRRSSR